MRVVLGVLAVAAVVGFFWGWIGASRRLKRRERSRALQEVTSISEDLGLYDEPVQRDGPGPISEEGRSDG